MAADPRLPLAEVALPGRRPARSAVTPDADRRDWLACIAGWRRAFAAAPAGDVALHFDDAYRFSAAARMSTPTSVRLPTWMPMRPASMPAPAA